MMRFLARLDYKRLIIIFCVLSVIFHTVSIALNHSGNTTEYVIIVIKNIVSTMIIQFALLYVVTEIRTLTKNVTIHITLVLIAIISIFNANLIISNVIHYSEASLKHVSIPALDAADSENRLED